MQYDVYYTHYILYIHGTYSFFIDFQEIVLFIRHIYPISVLPGVDGICSNYSYMIMYTTFCLYSVYFVDEIKSNVMHCC